MKKALISTVELVTNYDGTSGYRVADISDTEFEVAPTLFWMDCDDEVTTDIYYFDTQESIIKLVPIKPPVEVVGTEPNVLID